MVSTIDKLTTDGCSADNKDKVCRSRGGESCAFDGAMIVLQPIADTAHIVHGPIACCGNSWEGRGTLSSRGDLHTRGFTTDMGEIDIVYGSEEKLLGAIRQAHEAVNPKAVFVYSTCVSGLIGEDIDAVCKRAENELGVRVIPVNAPGFVGPKNLGNRIAGEVLLEHVIGTGESPVLTHTDINLIGEYNIAGDLWLVEPLLAKAGIRVLSRITGDTTFQEITWAHQAKLNVVVCGRALVNVAKEMERRYGIPYVEASFFGSTEIAKALRAIAGELQDVRSRIMGPGAAGITASVETLIKSEEKRLRDRLNHYRHLHGKKAVLYTGGVKSWSFISALKDLGIDIAAVGTKKSTAEDEQKMRDILGPEAPLVEDVTPKNLLALLKDRKADMLIAGGRNKYLAAKEGYPFVDVNQERHTAYAGYAGLLNLAEQITNSLYFYRRNKEYGSGIRGQEEAGAPQKAWRKHDLLIDPLKHSPAVGAAMALQGVDRALPIMHGTQGCTFLGKVLLTSHFREPIALATSKLFVEDVVMGSEDKLADAIEGAIQKNSPDLIGVLTTGLSDIKGDDVASVVKRVNDHGSGVRVLHIPTPDYAGGLETGYARAVEAIIRIAESRFTQPSSGGEREQGKKQISILAGPHLTPADFGEIREIVESFGLKAVMLPDLSALDGSRQGVSPLSSGGTPVRELDSLQASVLTLALGVSMEPAAKLLRERLGVDYLLLESCAGLSGSDLLMQTLAKAGNRSVPPKYERQRRVLIDAMRDSYEHFGRKKVCIALEPDHAVQTSMWLDEMGAVTELAVIPTLSSAADRIRARVVDIGDLSSVQGDFDVLISNSHARATAGRIGIPLLEMGFPVHKTLGYTAKVTIGYRGTLSMVHEAANMLMKRH